MKAVKKEDGTVVSENVIVADTFLKRLRGLMFTKELERNSSLLIKPCNSIHMFFMNYSIDVLYLDRNENIVFIEEDLKPGKIGKHVKKASSVLELPSGKAKETGIKEGDTLEYRNY